MRRLDNITPIFDGYIWTLSPDASNRAFEREASRLSPDKDALSWIPEVAKEIEDVRGGTSSAYWREDTSFRLIIAHVSRAHSEDAPSGYYVILEEGYNSSIWKRLYGPFARIDEARAAIIQEIGPSPDLLDLSKKAWKA